MEKYYGFVDYVLQSDNSVGITQRGQAPSKNYFVAKIHGKNPTPESLAKLDKKEVAFILYRQNETSVTDSIEIV